MLLIRVVLVPFWRGLPPAEFRTWFREHWPRQRGLMAPLSAGGALASAGAAATRVAARDAGPAPAALAAAAGAGVVAVTLAVNEPANHRFAGGALDDDETTALLARWRRWHDVRVALGLVGAAAAALALVRDPG